VEEELIERIFGPRECVGLTELSLRLGVHRETLRRAIRRGRLRAVKVGGAWRVTRAGLAAYLAASRAARGMQGWRSLSPPRARCDLRVAPLPMPPGMDSTPPSSHDGGLGVEEDIPF